MISFQKKYDFCEHCYVLSSSGDLHEAAGNLFKVLRDIDQNYFDLIVAENFPDKGIGMAINDRLSRAVQ